MKVGDHGSHPYKTVKKYSIFISFSAFWKVDWMIIAFEMKNRKYF
jgi:hypothetical protein